jgi:cytochrome c oxidase subunit III
MSEVRPAEQFSDLAQQHDAAELGMWVFLGSEVLLFGALLLGYCIYRFGYPSGFAEAARHTSIAIGTINTAILLTSSFLVAWAVNLVKANAVRLAAACFWLAAACGVAFLILKGFEYSDEYREHLVPGLDFRFDGRDHDIVRLFFSYYFVATGLHGLHILIGVAVLSVIAIRTRGGRYSSVYHAPPMLAGLYWHFVDLIWLFLFALIYLPGRSA